MPLRLLVKDAATTRISLGMFILCSVQNFGYYGVMIWLPNYLVDQFGFGLTASAIWTAVTVLGMAFGIWLFGQLADRIGRRPVFFAYMVGARVMVVGLFAADDPNAAADRRRHHGPVRQRHAGRLRRADERTLSDRGAGDRAERAVQPRPRRSAASGRSSSARWPTRYSFARRSRCWRCSTWSTSSATARLIPERKGAALQ